MITLVPPVGFILDFVFGALMWTNILQFALMIVVNENSSFILFRGPWFKQTIQFCVNFISPDFLTNRLTPLYVAMILFVLRYYFLPLTIGYEIFTFSDLPLEKLIISAKEDLGF